MWWYAIEYAYGSDVVNNGNRADVIYQFSSRRLRDAWVADGAAHGPGERRAVSARHPLVRRTPWRMRVEGDEEAWQILATQRVERSTELERHKEICLYDWGSPEHYRWLATAPESEIVSWARAVAAAE